MSRRSYSRRYECGPEDKISTFKATLVHSRRSRSPKLKLLPALATPKNKRNLSSKSQSGSKRRKVNELLASVTSSARAGQSFNSEWQNERDLFVPFDLPQNEMLWNQNSSNDYLREWRANKETPYLDAIISHYAPSPHPRCSICSDRPGDLWRCADCFGSPLFCTRCCREKHIPQPFHRVEVWNSTHFTASWLWRTGLTIRLCRTGDCPTFPPLESISAVPLAGDCTYGAKPDWRVWGDEGRVLVVVHTNGVHHIPVQYCTCVSAPENDLQLLQYRLYPATSKDTRTAFTFSLLDDYLLQNLECYTSAFHFYSKLRRLTNKSFPKKVPDRYRELLRCSREWRRLKELKRHGFGHLSRRPMEGEMALYCAACPQVGVNIPENWEEDPDQWKYYVTLVADGNFSLIHRKQKVDDDVWLKSGEGYLVERHRYNAHLKVTVEKRTAPTCNEHRAIEDRSKTHKGCDVTGVGAFACSRHGCFAPGSVVDFQKGERQMNMDYGLCGAIRSTKGSLAKRLNLLYDIGCQYSQKLVKRLQEGEYLSYHESLELVFGIGKFHVFGHQEKCYARYSPMFIEGTGWTSGEILESLWAILNEASRPTQTMTLAHRTEVLDAVIADSNWKKMINLIYILSSNYEKSLPELLKATEAFDLLNETASESQRTTWQNQLNDALKKRVRDVSAMDVLNVELEKPPTRSKVQHDLMANEQRENIDVGVTSWLTLGLKIQEAQLNLKAFIRSLPRVELRTDIQSLEIVQRRERIQLDLDEFLGTAARLFPTIDLTKYDNPPETTPEIDDEDPEDMEGPIEDVDNPFTIIDGDVEDVEIPMPSSFADLPNEMRKARKKEIQLRIAQANDALEGVRADIGHKSFLYRSNIRLAEGKKQKTRGYQSIKAADASMRHHIRLYNQARWALGRLKARTSVIERFQPIRREDTKAITAIYRPNAPGQSKTVLSWIWGLDVSGDSDNSPYLRELYRVNWLRAKSRLDRWREEHILLRSEMDWVLRFFAVKEESCLTWVSGTAIGPGHLAYANRQAEMWRLLRAEGERCFAESQKRVEQLKAEEGVELGI